MGKLEALMLLRDVRLMQGKIVEAEALLRRCAGAAPVAGDNDRRIRAKTTALRYELAYLHWLSGDLAGAKKEVEEVEEALRPGPGGEGTPLNRLEALKLKGFLLLEMDRIEEFERVAGEAREIAAAQSNPKLMRTYYHLLGRAEMRKGEPKKASEYFWKALDATSVPGPELDGADPWIFYDLADAIERSAGHPDFRALPIYEKILSPLVNRLHHGDMYALSLYRVARIHEQMCRNASAAEDIRTGRAKAVEHYRKFLELWKDADPIFSAEIRDARERLAALESETGLPRNTDPPHKMSMQSP